MKTTVKKLPKSTIKLTVTLEAAKVKETYEHVLEHAVEHVEIDGFRKGKAPKKMVEEKLGVSKLYGDVVNELLQTYYPQALKENAIMPISNPKVEIKEFDLEKDFEFVAEVAVKPEIKIGNYKKYLKEAYETKKKVREQDNAERLKKGEKLEVAPVLLGSNEVIDAIAKVADIEIADILVEEETNRIMARLVDQAQAIGMSMEDYLKAQGKTAEQLRAEYDKLSTRNITAEFALGHLVQQEKITVEDKEIDEMINAAGDPKVREQMQDPREKLYIKVILQKNKLITKIIEDAEKEFGGGTAGGKKE